VLNCAVHHVDIWGSRGMALCILNLSTRWGWVVSFMPQSWSGHSAKVKSHFLHIPFTVSDRFSECLEVPSGSICK